MTQETLSIRAGDAQIAVKLKGEGPALLLVHGFPFDHTMWKHQLAGLGGWRRIAPDLRGAGASSAPSGGYSVARYAEDLVAVLDELDVHEAVVCGLSMGGYILFELLRRYPARVRAAVLCDTKAEPDDADAKRGRDELIDVTRRHGPGAVAERLVPKLLAPQTLAGQPDVVRHVWEMIRRVPVAGMIGALEALRDRPDSRPTLGTIRVPVLVVGGEEDVIAPRAGMEAMTAAIRGARFVPVPEASHLAPLEQPLAATRALAEFLSGL